MPKNWNLRDKKVLTVLYEAIRERKLFTICVGIPTTIALLYFGLIASDIYVSESRFVVRSPDKQSINPLGLMLKGAGFSRSQDDSYSVQDFVTSRDALKALLNDSKLMEMYSGSGIDIFSKFDGFHINHSFEALHRYYQKRVVVELDSSSGISTLMTEGFTAQDAYEINKKLLTLAEVHINRLNERARQDMILFATNEVSEAESKAKNAAIALSSYRNNKSVVDPDRESSIQLQQIAKLQESLIASQSQLAQLQSFAENNPQIPAIKKKIELLQRAVQSESAGTTNGARSLAGKAVEYQRLVLEQQFADRQLASALASLEQARNEADRQQLYLERVVEPGLPDEAIEPRRLRALASTLILGLICWGILKIFIAGVQEHQD